MNEQHSQPYSFKVNSPFNLQDAQGNKFRVNVVFIYGRTSLVDYQRVN
jgi:hypothetical protein